MADTGTPTFRRLRSDWSPACDVEVCRERLIDVPCHGRSVVDSAGDEPLSYDTMGHGYHVGTVSGEGEGG